LIEHLYLHIPFCHRVCPYCSFYKHTPGSTDMEGFVKALLGELKLHQRQMEVRPRTIFLGGGTPTALSETHLRTLLAGLREALDLSALAEFCLEANPRTIGLSKAKMLREQGVTRVSLGVQAWDEPTLKLLGRDHSPGEAEETYDELRQAEIPSVNLDLMFSIPGLSLETWCASVKKSIALKPDHISAYNLTYEEDTEFIKQLQRGELNKDGERDADDFFAAMDLLEAAGFEHYEISNYAKPGHRSSHNTSYWLGADYLGLGPSAFSTVNRQRWKNAADTAGYMELIKQGRVPVVESEELDERKWLFERVALELRTSEGMPSDRVQESLMPKLRTLAEEGLLQVKRERVILTRTGKPLADMVAEALLPDN
jgi:oxygen-independent coproporphyrinogen-3 oxidase